MEKWQEMAQESIDRAATEYPALALTSEERATRQADIEYLKKKLHETVERHEPIDLKAIQALDDLRQERAKDLQGWHRERQAEMEIQTQAWHAKIPKMPNAVMMLHSQQYDKIHDEDEKYDAAALRWVTDEVGPWIDSEAAAIAAGIVILFNEIC